MYSSNIIMISVYFLVYVQPCHKRKINLDVVVSKDVGVGVKIINNWLKTFNKEIEANGVM